MLENLKHLRSVSGISQKTLAENIGICQQSINKYENHNIEPDIATLIRISDYFNVSIDYLVGHSSSPLPPSSGTDQLTLEESLILSKYRALSEKQKKVIQLLLNDYF